MLCRMRRALLVLLLLALFAGCGHGLAGTAALRAPLGYADPARWLCLPGRDDACAADRTATEILPDGSRRVVPGKTAANPKVDCFYVYPTVDLQLVPGNHAAFPDARIDRTTFAQAANFREACALYVPYYRQVTIGTYLRPHERLERGLAIAYADVEAAFKQYLAAYNHGRKIVLIGHSQGAEMVVRLLREFFDEDPSMRDRLLLAMPIGGDVEVAPGKRTGGTFRNLPVCASATETGCVVAYRSYRADHPVHPRSWYPKPGLRAACVDPANVGSDAEHRFSRAVMPLDAMTRRHLRGVDGIVTPFVVLPDFYSGRCVRGPGDYAYLAVTTTPPPGDARVSPIDFDRDFDGRGLLGPLGLHVLDMQLTQGDLLDMVATRAERLP